MPRAIVKLGRIAGMAALILGAGGLALGGYLFLTSLPDLRRYVRIDSL
jgi:hypothetical protein